MKNFKLKFKHLIFAILVGSATFIGCTQDSTEQTLGPQEASGTIKIPAHLRTGNTLFSYNDLGVSSNPYNGTGRNYYTLLKDFKTQLAAGNLSTQSQVNAYLASKNISSYSTTLTAAENSALVNFMSTFSVPTGMAQIINFENSLSNSTSPNLLKALTIYKYGLYFGAYSSIGQNPGQGNVEVDSNISCTRGNRDCLDRCVCNKAYQLTQANWVDQAWFVATCAESLAQWVAGCAWDCW